MFPETEWQRGNISDAEHLDALACALSQLLHKLASDACHANHPDTVHFMVEQQRKLDRMVRHISERMPAGRR
jgi:hypothetical protein